MAFYQNNYNDYYQQHQRDGVNTVPAPSALNNDNAGLPAAPPERFDSTWSRVNTSGPQGSSLVLPPLASPLLDTARSGGPDTQQQQQPRQGHRNSDATPQYDPPLPGLTQPIGSSPAAQSLGFGEMAGSGAAHGHTDTYEKPLPPEALGARQLIEYIFTPHVPGRPHSTLSPPSVVTRPSPREIGWPMPLLAEPVNRSTGRRLVFFGKSLQPQFVVAEVKNRFVAVVFKPILSAAAAAVVGAAPTLGDDGASTGYTSYGTVLGYSDDNAKIIWHDRSERFASAISLSAIQTIHRASAMQCRHCGFVLLKQELREHMSTHKKGSGVEYGVFTDDEALGMLCGDSGLMQSVESPRRLGEGAQGVVDLMDVVQPTTEEVAQAGPSSAVYRFVSAHLSHDTRLTKVVLKSMRFNSDAQALAEYQKSVRFMTVMQHPHLVEYIAVQLKPDHRTLCICMPYYQESDLATMIRNFKGDRLEENFICSIALQLTLALAFLHERNPPIVHGDLKVENVMFYNNKQQIVLMDLDASHEVLGGYQEAVQTSLGTTAYMAPETLKVERLMPSSDMWSLGVLLFVLTVLPDFPMIENPNTHNLDLLNADCWATGDDLRAMESYSSSALGGRRSNAPSLASGSGNSGVTLGECVRKAVTGRRYSESLAQLIVDLLSYNPLRRPTADAVGGRLTDIMTECLLQS